MDLSAPHRAVSPTVDGAVLMVLARTTRPLTGREIGVLAERSEAGVRRALRRLSEHGLITTQEAGKALLHTLNRDHVAAPAVEHLAELRAELVARLKAEVGDWSIKPVRLALFGSAARGDGDTRSDIDLLLIRPVGVSEADPTWEGQLRNLKTAVLAWTGNHAALAELSEADAARLEPGRLPIAADLERDAITIWGEGPD
jgi:DNA-binding transcriptional ArsR family regulator